MEHNGLGNMLPSSGDRVRPRKDANEAYRKLLEEGCYEEPFFAEVAEGYGGRLMHIVDSRGVMVVYEEDEVEVFFPRSAFEKY